jgi:hypothetical protein
VSKFAGCFVVYWPCGIHVCGAALDDGDDVDGFTGKMLVDAVRDGQKVEYRKVQDVLSVALQKCTCSEMETEVCRHDWFDQPSAGRGWMQCRKCGQMASPL